MEKKLPYIARLTTALIKNNVMKEEEAQSLFQTFKDRTMQETAIIPFLLQEGIVEREEILDAISIMYEIESFDVSGHFFNHELLLLFPKEFLMKYAIIPLDIDEDIMTVIMANPDDEEAIDELGNYVNYNINVNVGIRDDIFEAIREYYEEDLVSTEIDEEERAYDGEFAEDDPDSIDF